MLKSKQSVEESRQMNQEKVQNCWARHSPATKV